MVYTLDTNQRIHTALENIRGSGGKELGVHKCHLHDFSHTPLKWLLLAISMSLI